jgi:hypothetical protein
VDAFEERRATTHTVARVQAAKYLARQLNEMSTVSAQSQARAVSDAARSAVQAELRQALNHLTTVVDKRMAPHRWRPPCWWRHVITAGVVAGATWLLAMHLMCR